MMVKDVTDEQLIEYIRNHQGGDLSAKTLAAQFHYSLEYMRFRITYLQSIGKIQRIQTILICEED